MGSSQSNNRQRRQAGTPNSIADLRGGPSTAMGIDVQRLIAMAQTLVLLDSARYDPAEAPVVRLEPRLFIDGGQLGYDFGWEQSRHTPAELWEVKANPTLGDVREFVARLPRLRRNGESAKARFVFATPTAAARLLENIFLRAGEATDEEHLARIVEQAGKGGEKELLELLGEHPLQALAAAVTPCHFPERVAEELVTLHCRHQSMPGRADDLQREVDDEVVKATRTRGSISLAALRDRLDANGILRPAALADLSNLDPGLRAAVGLLELCPLPLPLRTVARGLDVEPVDVESILADLVTVGRVTMERECAWMPVISSLRVGSSTPTAVYESALAHLVDEAGRNPGPMSVQTPNAEALAALVTDHNPGLVARTFAAFDKPSKAYGDLGLIYRLARMSTQATISAARLAIGNGAGNNELLSLRARNLICGDAWVLQRVDELDRASEAIRSARAVSEMVPDDLRNQAFADKCEGRLLRMWAEQDLSDPAASELLERSKELLTGAVPKFVRLSATDPQLLQDAGESLSLLGRTLLVEGRDGEGSQACNRARTYLDAFPTSKAFGDLVLLEAEVAAYGFQTSGGTDPDDDSLREHLSKVADVRKRFFLHRPTHDRAASELVARGHVVAAQLLTLLGELDKASAEYANAEALNRELKYFNRAHEAAWAAAQLHQDAVPPPLATALAERKADAAVSNESLRLFNQRCEGQGLAVHDALSIIGDDQRWWEGLVEEAEHAVAAQRPQWMDREIA